MRSYRERILERDEAASGSDVGGRTAQQLEVVRDVVEHRDVGDHVEALAGRFDIGERVRHDRPGFETICGGFGAEAAQHRFRRIDGGDVNTALKPRGGGEAAAGTELQDRHSLLARRNRIHRCGDQRLVGARDRAMLQMRRSTDVGTLVEAAVRRNVGLERCVALVVTHAGGYCISGL